MGGGGSGAAGKKKDSKFFVAGDIKHRIKELLARVLWRKVMQ